MMACSHIGKKGEAAEAFTLLELLVVIAIIGILAAVGLPAIRGMTKSNALAAADRQLLDDLGYARLRAMADHTTVFVVFVPPYVANAARFQSIPPSDVKDSTLLSNLYSKIYTTYALISLRSVGDQPGQHTPHYLTDWRTLPNGVYIATNKFTPGSGTLAPPFAGVLVNPVQFPFPGSTNVPLIINTLSGPNQLPYIAFNYLGQLVQRVGGTGGVDVPVVQLTQSPQVSAGKQQQQDEYIPLARGSIMYYRNGDGSVDTGSAPDVQENPPGNAYYAGYTNCYTGQPLTGPDAGKVYNQIHIDPLTGRAHAETLQVQ